MPENKFSFRVRDLAGGTNQLLPGPDSATSSSTELEKKFAPYVRRDAYGAMGRGELPAMEKVLLGLAILTLVPI
ncbi:hypothetical protein Cni_G19052 [Canna indica]|uniref:Uncharacterized protein n=1 Tax=Canna indica TaxID=4628 RepID=A0AAQ3KMC3_9LILI|nr:hypothetical protein Cni_G19052 [Canna indica]